jgi:twinkle protein
VGQKVRGAGKQFRTTGDFKSVVLFGQHLWREGGRRVVITEGEVDCLSLAQAFNLSWPVVSLPNGAQSARKAIEKSAAWLSTYDQVVLCFDMDEPGQKAAEDCIDILPPGKVAIAQLPLKDANEMLVAGRVKELTTAIWEAQVRRPGGIVCGADLWEQVSKPVVMGTPYPWEGLNKVLYGLRPREIVTLTAGSGIGKSAVCSEVAYHLAVTLGQPIGYVALEESVARAGLRFLGHNANLPLHLPGHQLDPDGYRAAFDATLGTGRIWLYDHFGSVDSDDLLGKLRYMVQGCGVKWLFLDHLSIVVSGMDLDGDERRMIDHTMTELRTFTEQTECGLILVSHLKRPQGIGHEEGAKTSLAQLRGSQAIAQLSDIVIGWERDQQAEEEEERSTLVARVLKNRYAGTTGVAAALKYNAETGRLTEVPFVFNDDGEVSVVDDDLAF